MENASKALIMAGAILIAIMIVSLGIMIFSNMSNSAKNASNLDEQVISNFNSRITPYVGKKINGSQVNALIQLVISINNSAINNGNLDRTVSISYKSVDDEDVTISVQNKQLTGNDKSKKVKTGSGIYYNVSASYGDNGLINTIKVQ